VAEAVCLVETSEPWQLGLVLRKAKKEAPRAVLLKARKMIAMKREIVQAPAAQPMKKDAVNERAMSTAMMRVTASKV